MEEREGGNFLGPTGRAKAFIRENVTNHLNSY
jgi:hypothetical protein